MFTGIIEALGRVERVEQAGSSRHFWIYSPFTSELRPDQSVAHDGCCLTVEEINSPLYRVTAIEETLRRTNLGRWCEGYQVNLERALRADGRWDGHFVQGHVDACGRCEGLYNLLGSWELRISFPPAPGRLLVIKGSIAVNGVSLTIVQAGIDFFTVHLIPYTYNHTNLRFLKPGDPVNLEFDILGKYVAAWLQRTYESIPRAASN
ncbi:MAG: riboflavin synthase [Flavobacteriales bacterium]|nr:riboflavin synthase [Flavobacteriales bacterium]MCX7769002.1 riboflavin synthase [Flavobacteriales bacterium]MDW8410209.1 riboflavin synthase [Flavobacteriales bacterium]